jgi:hypothetical protein
MFEIDTSTPAKLVDVVVLSQKNRAVGDAPGAKLSVSMALGNDSLVLFDGTMKSYLYTKLPDGAGGPPQPDLPIVDAPNLTPAGKKTGRFNWELELTGYTMTLDTGLGGARSNLEIKDCALSNFRLHPKEGGTVIADFDIESQDITEKAFGKLATLKSREIALLLAPPEPGGQGELGGGD